MSDNDLNSSKRRQAIKRLADDLSRLNVASRPGTIEDEEMLSLIVEEAYQGIDISQRYPTFYKKLLNHPDLRQAFIDVLESIDDEEENRLIPWAEGTDVELDFLAVSPIEPVIEKLGEKWMIGWQRTIDQLQTIFSPSEMAYRSDTILSEDLWFILLRGEVEIEGFLYTVTLECTFSEDEEEALSPFLNIAVTIGLSTNRPQFPVQTSLQWGAYKETLIITDEGRARFPDIPIDMVFDDEHKNISADLHLILEPIT